MRRAVVASLLAGACGCGMPGRTYRPLDSYVEGPAVRSFAVRSGATVPKESPPRLDWQPAIPRPPIERRLSNGVPVFVVQRREFPSVDVLFVLDRGASVATPGIAALYAQALLGDSGAFDRDEAHAYLRFVGASVSSAAWNDAVVLRVTALSPFIASALSRAVPMFISPKLSTKNLEEARTLFADDHGEAEAATAARRALLRGLFPSPHPYATPAELVSAADVANVDRRALERFRDAYVNAARVRIIATGDVDPDALVRVLERELRNLPRTDASAPPAIRPSPLACHGQVQIVDRPGAKQSSIAIGWPGAAAGEADAGPLELLAAASGGWLSSRLNLTIRKELGATYGVHARAQTFRHGGTLELTAAVDTPRTADALRGILTEIERLRTEPLDAAELDSAKTKALYGETGQSTQGLGALLAHAAAFGLPAAHVALHASQRNALSAEDVRAAAERRLEPARRCIVVVGDAAKITEGISALGAFVVDVERATR